MTTSPAPISAADREVDPDDLGDALEAAGMSIGVPRPQMLALAARVVELEAALAKYRCPLGMENGSNTCSAGSCPECLVAYIEGITSDAEAAEARATALLEALTKIATGIQAIDLRDANEMQEVARAAINAGASNDRK